MNINIIYESQFGNGKKLVEELAAILEDKDQKVDLFPVSEIEPDKLPVAELYIFSSPTRKFTLPGIWEILLKDLPHLQKMQSMLL